MVNSVAAKKGCCPKKHGAKFLSLFLIWRLARSPMHAYALMGEIRELAISPCKPSTIYVILDALEKRGLIRGRLRMHGKRARKTYATTSEGKALFKKIKKDKIKGLIREFIGALL
ncbi:hypothetical protein COT30_04965 [Candidatus Micrarchaeota archaeon CG08_land_8_20_14_0_20_49_17]|nr:MAG: hypothetical protein AUJ13_02045 [Candidatus Micrarchaeota archaeon CG1_02_49_24]PIU09331.1 MAG: hypothetical protein COT30_04965 [Candidatus Micrarchaeota archaeon CG08_land_8_20_14_0_20_49_17]